MLAEKQIFWLDIAMDDVVRVAVLYTTQELPHDFHHLNLWEPIWLCLQVLEDGAIYVLKHKIQLSLAPKNLDEVDNVLMLELFQDAHFSKCCLAHQLILVTFLEFFDGN